MAEEKHPSFDEYLAEHGPYRNDDEKADAFSEYLTLISGGGKWERIPDDEPADGGPNAE